MLRNFSHGKVIILGLSVSPVIVIVKSLLKSALNVMIFLLKRCELTLNNIVTKHYLVGGLRLCNHEGWVGGWIDRQREKEDVI